MEQVLKNKKIIVGITGSIAAYKAPLLIRELVKAGASVHAVLTPSALNFVTPMTLANLTRNKVLWDMFDESSQSGGAWHIEMVHSSDMMIIAPCSAASIGKIANGICDNSLVTLAVALPKGIPLLVAPAMDYSMFQHPTTQRNIRQLESDGAIIIPPAEGELSSGLVGPGRLPDTDVLMEYIYKAFKINIPKINTEVKSDETCRIDDLISSSAEPLQTSIEKDKWQAELEFTQLKQKMGLEESFSLKGKKVLITAGPTVEKIDDVRYISNFSSGKMGFALAEAASLLGAEVTLVTGPVNLDTKSNIQRINVVSADEMYNEATKLFPACDIAILSAAVADFTPKEKFDGKMKKNSFDESINLELVKTKDILAELGKSKKSGQKLVGFALESTNEIENGWKKMKEKNCTIIVVNSAGKKDSGFGSDNNTITILSDDGKQETFPPMSKLKCAFEILRKIV